MHKPFGVCTCIWLNKLLLVLYVANIAIYKHNNETDWRFELSERPPLPLSLCLSPGKFIPKFISQWKKKYVWKSFVNQFANKSKRTRTIGLNLMYNAMMIIVVVLANTIDFDQMYRMMEIDSRTKEKILAFGETLNHAHNLKTKCLVAADVPFRIATQITKICVT